MVLFICIGVLAAAAFGALVWSRVKTARRGIESNGRPVYRADGSAGGGFHGDAMFGGDCSGGGGSDCGIG